MELKGGLKPLGDIRFAEDVFGDSDVDEDDIDDDDDDDAADDDRKFGRQTKANQEKQSLQSLLQSY